ncbi:Fatty acid synthase, partial [Stegodyphus mimosarum]
MQSEVDYHEYCSGGFDPDDIVISGVAGRFPNCETVGELKEALLTKKDLILFSDERFEKGASGMPHSSVGLVKNLDKFDAQFFHLTNSTADYVEPQQRKVLEVTYEAIFDSGYDATSLRGAHIGVYNATTCDDAKEILTQQGDLKKNVCISIGRYMNANRISFAFDFHGPSFSLDAACASSALALWNAFHDISNGRVEAAVVSACQVCLSPSMYIGYMKSGMCSQNGKCIPFDAKAEGIVRCESICALFLQKASVARRVYATVSNVSTRTTGAVAEGISVPSFKEEVELFQDCLKGAGITPQDIDFVEAHGTGTVVGDPIELNAISSVYCEGRETPLLIGTIKGNVGHTEASSGICGILKGIISFETGLIPPNYGYNTPNPHCPALVDGRMVVVTEPVPLTKPYIPVNCFGFGGSIVQTMLKQNPIESTSRPGKRVLPNLVLYPATTEEGVLFMFNYIKENPNLNAEFFALLNKLSFTPTLTKPFRGYAVYENEKEPIMQVKNALSEKRQVWFVLTGMGCQWPGMGLQLMGISAFAESIKKSAAVLKPYGVDLFEFLRPDKNDLLVERSITPAFVSIVAIQIALIDVLKFLDIHPDGIVGHSTGELVCAYADGCCTAEQTILSAYWRGISVERSSLPEGAMAAVGLTWDEAVNKCPENVYPACDNASDSVTISGLKEPVQKFVEQLKSENVFARIVDAYGYAFHCKLVCPAKTILYSALEKLIPDPKPRSERWISSSFSEEEWDLPECKMAGPEYFIHNLTSSVRFKDALSKIPSDAITIEIGPHFLLQAILKRAIGSNAAYISLMKRKEENNLNFFLESLGKLYLEGLDPKIERLYPPVKFPVPRSTPMLSDLIKWNHSHSFSVPKWAPSSTTFVLGFDLQNDDSYLMDHKLDGRSLFPATGYIYLAWKALAEKHKKAMDELPVVIENFKIRRATVLNPSKILKFEINLLDISGNFEIMEGQSLVAFGKVYVPPNPEIIDASTDINLGETSRLPGEQVYNELKLRGYEYGREFRGVTEMNIDGTGGLVSWNEKWIPFLDSLLLFSGVLTQNEAFCLPTAILSFKINPNFFKEKIAEHKENGIKGVSVTYDANMKRCRCAGVEITELSADTATRRLNVIDPILEEHKFIPYVNVYTPSEEHRKQILQYKNACNAIIDKLGEILEVNVSYSKFPQENFDTINNISKDRENDLSEIPQEEQQLLTVLKQISESDKINNLIEKRGEFISSYLKGLGEDFLNKLLLNQCSMRIMFDIISENSFRRINLLEVNYGTACVLPIIIELTKDYPDVRFKSSIVSPFPVKMDSDFIESHQIQVYGTGALTNFSNEKSHDVVISSFLKGSQQDLQDLINSLSSVLKHDGFIFFYHKTEFSAPEKLLFTLCGQEIQTQSEAVLNKTLLENNLVIISKISYSLSGSLYLLRHPSNATEHKILTISENSNFQWVEDLKLHLADDNSGTIWLACEEYATSGTIGMVNCLKHEPGGERVRCVFIEQPAKGPQLPPFSLDEPFYNHIVKKNLLMNVWKNGAWGSFRHLRIHGGKLLEPVEHSFAICAKTGDLSSFEWRESHIKYTKLRPDQTFHVYYSALNFRDIMIASGKLSAEFGKDPEGKDDVVVGIECSGKDSNGRRLAGIVRNRSIGTSNKVESLISLEVPDNWTLEDAATVPVVYMTCYYALITRANLQHGESILIHSGTGGIGFAAICIALSLQCEIFTTVGTEEKKEYLKKTFPQIKEENIGCSRDLSFEVMVKTRTAGRGVDVVLNSLADDKFLASIRCVAEHGRFVELGKYDLSLDREIGLKRFLDNITFHGVFIDRFLYDLKSSKFFMQLNRLMQEGIKNGVVRPLDRTVFEREDIEKAFRYMAGGTHIGKVLIKIRDEEKERFVKPKILKLPAIPYTQFYDTKVYIIIGGLGGFGIELTKWMIKRGAQKIILTSRYGARTPYHFLCLKRWKEKGCLVHVSQLNVAKKDEAKQLLELASQIGPVGGIFNSAVVLKDAFMENQTAPDFQDVSAPKAEATKNLDELSRKFCPDLDYFVCFSSISCGRGNAGQTNYGYANSAMERVCEKRSSMGYHGLAIQWGIIGEVGVVHRHMGDDARIAGVCAQSVKSCLDTLDTFCTLKYPVVSSYVTTGSSQIKAQGDVLQQIVKMLGMKDLSELNNFRSFGEMGIDSLVGIEIKNLLESACDVTLTMQEIREMKFDDVKLLLENAEKAKESSANKSKTLVTTAQVKLPAFTVHTEPIIPLNHTAAGKPVFIVTVGNGDFEQMQALGKSINNPAFALVWTKDIPSPDMEALCTWYLNKIKEVRNEPLHLVGFSTGGSIAFEMGLQSEKAGVEVTNLTLLDGSLDLRNNLSNEDQKGISEVNILCKFVERISPAGILKLREDLENVEHFDQRVKIVSNHLTTVSTHPVNASDLAEVIEAHVAKTKLNLSYVPQQKLKQDLHLIEDSNRILSNDIKEVKALFSEVCSGKIFIYRTYGCDDLSNEENIPKVVNVFETILKCE